MILNALYTVLIFLGVGTIIAVPATLSLPPGIRPGFEKLTIDEAARQLKKSNNRGWTLVKEAALLVHTRMQYCRRNSFDSYEKAFERGYGYCQQNAMHLNHF